MSTEKIIIQEIDLQVIQAFKKAAGYSGERFHAVQTEGSWSLQQVLFHLCDVTAQSLEVMQKQRGKIAAKSDAGLAGKLRSLLVKTLLWLPLKFKAPKQVSTVPNNVSLDQLKERWDVTIAGLNEMSDEFPEGLKDKPIFRHPAAGWFTFEQTLGFILDHNLHHQRQLDALYSWLDR